MTSKKYSKQVNEENLIHIKLDYLEAKENKKNILQSEINLIGIATRIKNYRELRQQELDKKIIILQKIKILQKEIIKIQKTLPKLKIPKILQKEEEETGPFKEEKTISTKVYGNSLEDQLEEIKDKLRKLQE